MFLVGSAALNFKFDNWRRPKDFDYIATELEYQNFCEEFKGCISERRDKKRGKIIFLSGVPYEFELCGLAESTNLLYEYMSQKKLDMATPDIILMMKMSHRFLKNSPHFLKTINDIKALKDMGIVMPDFAKTWLPIREKETYDYGHPNLNQSKKEFFKDDFYVYDHDTLHLAVKLYDKPAYDYFKPDKNEVKVSRALFDAAPDNVKLASVYEEACVLALERHQIPNSFKPAPENSFKIALEKVCTSITSGWWRDFAYDSYFLVLDMFKELGYNKYVRDFFKAKRKGILKPHGDN